MFWSRKTPAYPEPRIEKGVPIPYAVWSDETYEQKVIDTLSKMEVGDSIKFVRHECNIFIHVANKKLEPKAFAFARINDKVPRGLDSELMVFRIWRIE